MKSRKPGGVPYRMPPFAWQLAQQGGTAAGDTTVETDTSAEGSADNSQSGSYLYDILVL